MFSRSHVFEGRPRISKREDLVHNRSDLAVGNGGDHAPEIVHGSDRHSLDSLLLHDNERQAQTSAAAPAKTPISATQPPILVALNNSLNVPTPPTSTTR